jgi:hypothetical protein
MSPPTMSPPGRSPISSATSPSSAATTPASGPRSLPARPSCSPGSAPTRPHRLQGRREVGAGGIGPGASVRAGSVQWDEGRVAVFGAGFHCASSVWNTTRHRRPRSPRPGQLQPRLPTHPQPCGLPQPFLVEDTVLDQARPTDAQVIDIDEPADHAQREEPPRTRPGRSSSSAASSTTPPPKTSDARSPRRVSLWPASTGRGRGFVSRCAGGRCGGRIGTPRSIRQGS